MIRLPAPPSNRRLPQASRAVLAAALTMAFAWGAQDKPAAPAPAPPQAAKPAEFVGSTTCQGCHGAPHAAGLAAKFPKCGDCHYIAHDLNNWPSAGKQQAAATKKAAAKGKKGKR